MKTFTDSQFIAALKEAVAERGEDYVYPEVERTGFADDYHNANGTCQYQTPDGELACLIGLAVSKLDPEAVPAYGDARNASDILVPMGISKAVRHAAADAQETQDDGGTWGQAAEQFDATLRAMSGLGGRS